MILEEIVLQDTVKKHRAEEKVLDAITGIFFKKWDMHMHASMCFW